MVSLANVKQFFSKTAFEHCEDRIRDQLHEWVKGSHPRFRYFHAGLSMLGQGASDALVATIGCVYDFATGLLKLFANWPGHSAGEHFTAALFTNPLVGAIMSVTELVSGTVMVLYGLGYAAYAVVNEAAHTRLAH